MKRGKRNANIVFVITLVILVAITLFFGIRYLINRGTEVVAESAEYVDLRDRALQISWEDAGLPIEFDTSIPYGVVIDFYLENDLTTVTAYATGDASIYFGNGGGVMGGIGHANVRNAALEVVIAGAQVSNGLEIVTATPLPQKGQVYFYLLTIDGIKVTRGQASFLAQGGDALSRLYQAAQQLTEELRLVSENTE